MYGNKYMVVIPQDTGYVAVLRLAFAPVFMWVH